MEADEGIGPLKMLTCVRTDTQLARERYLPNCNIDDIVCMLIAELYQPGIPMYHISHYMMLVRQYLDERFVTPNKNRI